MHKAIFITAALAMVVSTHAFAADATPTPSVVRTARQNEPAAPFAEHDGPNLLASAMRESTRLAATPARHEGARWFQAPAPHRNWIRRHPVLFGALVGAGAGAVASVTMENELFCSGGDEDCFFHGNSRTLVGAGMGAGVGALVGLIAGLGSL